MRENAESALWYFWTIYRHRARKQRWTTHLSPFNSFRRFFDCHGKEIARLGKYDKHSCRTSYIVQNECYRRDIFRKSFVIYHATTFLAPLACVTLSLSIVSRLPVSFLLLLLLLLSRTYRQKIQENSKNRIWRKNGVQVEEKQFSNIYEKTSRPCSSKTFCRKKRPRIRFTSFLERNKIVEKREIEFLQKLGGFNFVITLNKESSRSNELGLVSKPRLSKCTVRFHIA